MNRLVNELESRDSEWKNTPLAARNRALLKKWKSQIKVFALLLSLTSPVLGLLTYLRTRLPLSSVLLLWSLRMLDNKLNEDFEF